MAQRLLEVGSGYNPALQNPGYVFEDDQLQYVAVDANRICPPYKVEWKVFKRFETPLHITGALAVMNALPFADETFDHVIMRSVIGEYSLHLLDTTFRGDPDVPNLLSGRSFTETMAGFTEVHRVLKPGGTLAIAEEDTPADSSRLAGHLRQTGFESPQITPFRADMFTGRFTRGSKGSSRHKIKPDFAWVHRRSKYWGTTPTRDRYGQDIDFPIHAAEDYYTSSYLMTCQRPMH